MICAHELSHTVSSLLFWSFVGQQTFFSAAEGWNGFSLTNNLTSKTTRWTDLHMGKRPLTKRAVGSGISQWLWLTMQRNNIIYYFEMLYVICKLEAMRHSSQVAVDLLSAIFGGSFSVVYILIFDVQPNPHSQIFLIPYMTTTSLCAFHIDNQSNVVIINPVAWYFLQAPACPSSTNQTVSAFTCTLYSNFVCTVISAKMISKTYTGIELIGFYSFAECTHCLIDLRGKCISMLRRSIYNCLI